MKLNFILYIFCGLGLFSCSKDHQSLRTDSTLNSIYNQQEIVELEKVLAFFQKEICSEKLSNLSDTLQCFRTYMDSLKSNMYSDSINLHLNFESQKVLYDQLNDNLFSDIWTMSWKIRSYSKTEKDTLKAIGYNSSGKFMELVKLTGEDHESINQYHYAIKSAGGLSPSAVTNLMVFPENYDITDVRIRLIIAVHYLTFNDDLERFEKVKISA